MEITFEFWYLFPISILIATIAMSSGVGGAVFFSPLFMLVLQLEPVFTIPGVITGGQLGPKLQKRIPEDKMKMAISLFFVGIGLFMFYTLAPGV